MHELRFGRSARRDITSILVRTEREFGRTARDRYDALIRTALLDLANDPERAGSRPRPEIGPGVRTYHLRHSRDRARTDAGGVVRLPRHLILYRLSEGEIVGVGRVLHDAMDLERRLPADYGDAG